MLLGFQIWLKCNKSLSLVKYMLHKAVETSPELVSSPAISEEQRVPFSIILST